MFCPSANQSLRVLGDVIEKGSQDHLGCSQLITRLEDAGLLEKGIFFADWVKLGAFLRSKKDEFKKNTNLFNKEQRAALDQGLRDILGDSLYS